jgi:predicted signal transduction protein with EAL and GGDEF domain
MASKTEAEADALRTFGCSLVSGYHYSKPLSEERRCNTSTARKPAASKRALLKHRGARRVFSAAFVRSLPDRGEPKA